MGIIRKIVGPKSKYDKSLPYTYMARIPIFPGDNEIYNQYFADTICGLIGYLDENKIDPLDVEIFGLYRGYEIMLDKKLCLDENYNWLSRPDICKSMESHFNKTLEIQYKGHDENSDCSFDDRSRKGIGPY